MNNAKEWDIVTGAVVARKLERLAIKSGLHVALGGSVLHAGHSAKDLDIIVYDHNTTSPGSVDAFIADADSLGLTGWARCIHKYQKDEKCVCRSATTEGRRIDFFFLCAVKPTTIA